MYMDSYGQMLARFYVDQSLSCEVLLFTDFDGILHIQNMNTCSQNGSNLCDKMQETYLERNHWIEREFFLASTRKRKAPSI